MTTTVTELFSDYCTPVPQLPVLTMIITRLFCEVLCSSTLVALTTIVTELFCEVCASVPQLPWQPLLLDCMYSVNQHTFGEDSFICFFNEVRKGHLMWTPRPPPVQLWFILYKRLQRRSEFCENWFIFGSTLLKGVMNCHLSISHSTPVALFIDVQQKQLSM